MIESIDHEGRGIAHADGCLYISDPAASVIRRMDLRTGAVTTLAGERGSVSIVGAVSSPGDATPERRSPPDGTRSSVRGVAAVQQ